MSWINLPQEDETPELERAVRSMRGDDGKLSPIVAVLTPRPKVMRAVMQMNRAVHPLVSYVFLAALSTGCGDVDNPIQLEDPAPKWTGSFLLLGQWDLAGPFSDGRTVGDAAAELVVDQIISLAGVPSIAEDRARELVTGLIAADIKSAVDANAPAELLPDSAIMQALSTALAQVTITSRVELDEGLLPRSVSGVETLVSLAYAFEGTDYEIVPADILPSPQVTIDSPWSGRVSSASTLEIKPHVYGLRYGELVRQVAATIVANTDLAALATQAQSAMSCSTLVQGMLGGDDSVGFEVQSVGYSVDATQLADACSTAQSAVGESALGLFAVDSPAEVGGTVLLVNEDGDDIAEALASGDSYGGTLNISPKAVAPRITVTFAGARP